jgi:acyl-CoA hydrolase
MIQQHGAVSRIVRCLISLVTDPRMDAELVVTEYGVANLKDKPTRKRTLSPIKVAHPKFADELTEDVHRAVLI